ncbi:hypothetical protein [Streptomyces sp. NPDC058718]|uniref:hypothetical protein n=1 Tax=Streptomyces sp. NPDC058718 TaxID=3346610 RepID=UPI003698A8F8
MRLRFNSRVAAAGWTALGLVVLLGCSKPGSEPEPRDTGQASVSIPPKAVESTLSPTPLRSHDPVTAFGEREVRLPDGAVALDAGTAWISAWDGLIAVDIASEKEMVSRPEGTRARTQPKLGPPVVADVSGRRLVVTATAIEKPGTGTQRTSFAVELVAADAATKEKVWNIEVPSHGGFEAGVDLRVVAVDRNIAVVLYGSDLWSVDLTTRATLWAKPNAPSTILTVADGVIATVLSTQFLEKQIVGLSVASGRQVWGSVPESDLKFVAAGPRHVLATKGQDLLANHTRLLEVATGRTVATPDVDPVPDTCSYDEAKTIVCGKYEFGQFGMFGLDAKSGAKLWELPTSDRNAPRFHSAWHGVVYAGLNGTSLTLDARTGRDRPDAPSQIPDLLNGFAGVFIDTGRTGRADETTATARETSG